MPSKLDLIFTGVDNVTDEIKLKEPLGESDQAVLEWNLLLETANKQSQEKSFSAKQMIMIVQDFDSIGTEFAVIMGDWNAVQGKKLKGKNWTSGMSNTH